MPLDTVLLPLIKTTMVLPPKVGITAGQGGGITVVDGKVIIADLRGAFFILESRQSQLKRLDLPPLPDDRAAFEKFGPRERTLNGFPIDFGFRVHDVESRKQPDGIRLFVSHERYLPDLKTTALAVSAITLRATDLAAVSPWEDIYQSQPLHSEWYAGVAGGSRLLVVGDELYVTVGDYNQDNVFMKSKLEAQNPDNDFGKILKVDLRTRQKTMLSMGHRNPQGLAATSNGTIYATEHGPKGGDLLTKVIAGSNYGWPIRTYGTHYTTYDWPNRKFDTGEKKFDRPSFVWVGSIATSNLVEGDRFHPVWAHDLLVTSLIGQSIFRVRLDDDGRGIYAERIAMDERLRDIAYLTDGTLVLWTDEGHLIFLTVDAEKLASNQRPP